MAKKDPKEMSVEEKLKTLFLLQTKLSQIDEKRELRGALPREVKDLSDEITGLNVRVEKIEHEITDYEQAVAQRQTEMTDAKQVLARYQQQLDDVKNNREYDSLTKEIEFQNLEIELCNKKIKEAQDTIKARRADIEHTKKQIEECQTDLDIKRSELEDIMIETREEEERLKAEVKVLEAKVEPRLLYSFTRIRGNARNGLGIVYVQRDACGGCFNKIPPQRQLDIKMHKKIIVCEYCGRIMIDPELAGVKIEKATEEKPKRRKSTSKAKKTTKEEDNTSANEEN